LDSGDFPGGASEGVVPAVDPESGRRSGGEFGLQLVFKQMSLVVECSRGSNGIEDAVRIALAEGYVPSHGSSELFIVELSGFSG
jgi:hypothetical protein